MTDEQIKQNAEAYCDENFSPLDVDRRQYAEEDFIAGAHSRDEEIEELKEEIESLKENEKELFEGFKKRGTKLGELMKENVKLRNPWISVEDRLPEKIKNKGVSKNVFVTWPDGTRGEAYYNYEEYKAPRWEIKGAGIRKPAYWMPIPELEKGK